MISKYAAQIEESVTIAITSKAIQLKKEGKPVLSFSAGEPDFDTPDYIKNAAIKAIQSGKTKYTAASGIPELKEAIVKKLQRDNDLTYKAESIVVSCGAKHSIYNVVEATVDPGDEVLIPAPFWVSYPSQVQLVGGIPKILSADDSTGYKITPQQLQKAITPKTKLLILNSPSNPTGVVYTKAELQALAQVLENTDVMVISDEIYEKLVYGTARHVSIAALSDIMKSKTIVINGLSKSYSMTGWRIGYCAAPKEIAKAMANIQSHCTSNPTTPSQWAAVAALEGGEETLKTMCVEFDRRRQYMLQVLNVISGVRCIEPTGAFYAFPDVSQLYGRTTSRGNKITDSVQFCQYLLEEALVACVPGAAFGAPNNIRLSYATSIAHIEEGLDRLKTWVERLQ